MDDHNRTADQRVNGHVLRILIWTVAWVVSLALARFGPEFLWPSQPVVSWIGVGLNIAVGIGWIVAHAQYLRGVDELQRKIMLDAIALALGVGLVGGFAYAAAQGAGLISVDDNIAFFTCLMGAVYAITTVVGTLRYR